MIEKAAPHRSTEEQTEYAMASTVARYVSLNDIRLNAVSGSLVGSRDLLIRNAPWEFNLNRDLSFQYNESSRILTVVAHLSLEVASEGIPRPAPNSLICSCIYHLDYLFQAVGGPEGKEQKTYFDAFAKVNGLYNIWPYFRELVQSTSVRFGIPPVILPVYRVSRSAEVDANASMKQEKGKPAKLLRSKASKQASSK